MPPDAAGGGDRERLDSFAPFQGSSSSAVVGNSKQQHDPYSVYKDTSKGDLESHEMQRGESVEIEENSCMEDDHAGHTDKPGNSGEGGEGAVLSSVGDSNTGYHNPPPSDTIEHESLAPRSNCSAELRVPSSTMIFSEFQRSQALAHRRRAMATTPAITEYEADLTSKDREKQKRAVKDVLRSKVRDDWVWEWPHPADETGISTPVVDEGEVADEESAMDEGSRGETWIERLEWSSNDSVDDNTEIPRNGGVQQEDPFTSSDGTTPYQSEAEKRKVRRRRRELQEMEYNDGMKCFTHRRNAWTGARHVPRTAKVVAEVQSEDDLKRTVTRESRRSSVLARITNLTSNAPKSPSTAVLSTSPTVTLHPGTVSSLTPRSTHDFIHNWLLLIPTNLHILPPETPMRKNVNEKAFGHIYDKVILQSQTPYCPINLSVVVRSCVEGWKRDGEWPPKAAVVAEAEAGMRRVVTGASIARWETRRSVGAGEKEKSGAGVGAGGLKNSLKKVFKGVSYTRRRSVVDKEKASSNGMCIGNGTGRETKDGDAKLTASPAAAE